MGDSAQGFPMEGKAKANVKAKDKGKGESSEVGFLPEVLYSFKIAFGFPDSARQTKYRENTRGARAAKLRRCSLRLEERKPARARAASRAITGQMDDLSAFPSYC